MKDIKYWLIKHDYEDHGLDLSEKKQALRSNGAIFFPGIGWGYPNDERSEIDIYLGSNAFDAFNVMLERVYEENERG